MARRRRGKTGGGIGALWNLQMQAAQLGMNWVEMSVGAAQVIATRTAMMGAAVTQPAKLADPEMALMVTEKTAAVGEAAERLSRRAVRGAGRRRVSRDPTSVVADTIDAAVAAVSPFHRRVRANVRRLGRKTG